MQGYRGISAALIRAIKVPPYYRMALGVLELSYKKLAFQECERGLGGQGVVDLGLLGLDIGFEGGLDVGS